MSNQKLIKNRIRSVKNTKKITKAMELVAASKMKRAVSATLSSRLYADYSWDLLTSLSGKLDEITHPFFIENTKSEKSLIILITSNRGLCGSYNSQAIKKALSILKTTENAEIISVGKKGDNAMRRIGQNIECIGPDNVRRQRVSCNRPTLPATSRAAVHRQRLRRTDL